MPIFVSAYRCVCRVSSWQDVSTCLCTTNFMRFLHAKIWQLGHCIWSGGSTFFSSTLEWLRLLPFVGPEVWRIDVDNVTRTVFATQDGMFTGRCAGGVTLGSPASIVPPAIRVVRGKNNHKDDT